MNVATTVTIGDILGYTLAALRVTIRLLWRFFIALPTSSVLSYYRYNNMFCLLIKLVEIVVKHIDNCIGPKLFI